MISSTLPLLCLALLAQEPALKAESPSEPIRRVMEYSWMSTADWNSRHERFVRRAREGSVNVLFLGDSITEGWGGT